MKKNQFSQWMHGRNYTYGRLYSEKRSKNRRRLFWYAINGPTNTFEFRKDATKKIMEIYGDDVLSIKFNRGKFIDNITVYINE